MLNLHTLSSAAGASHYFRENDANYYLGENDLSPEWTGALREHFQLERDVDHEHFARLLANKDPHTGEKITKAQRKDRDPGRDLTFSAPKSLSIAALVGGDDRIVAAHHRAVMATLALAEAEVNTRVRKGKVHEERNTGNWLVAVFTHLTGRPMKTKLRDGSSRMEPDPQLHQHAVAPNLTKDDTEGEIKAIHFQELKRNAGFYEAAYHALLANEMQALGYEVKRTKHAFELVGIPEAAITQFSRRKEEVEKKAAELGITRPESKAKLGATTRLPKEKATTKWEFLVSDWRDRLKPDDLAAVDRTVQAAREGGPIAREEGERAAVDYALAHLTERKSVVAERKVAEEALRFGVGSVTPESVAAEIAGRDLVRADVGGVKMVSTQEVLGEEQRIVAWAKEGRGKYQPMGGRGPDANPASRVGTVKARSPETIAPITTHAHVVGVGQLSPPPRHASDPATLSPSQSSAVRHVLTSRDRLILVRGAAGVGKTTILHALTSQLSGPWGVFATQTSASRGVLRDDGFKDANTLAHLLKDKPTQDRLRNGLIIIDEASQTGAREMASVVKLADQLSARILLLGDRRQHKSVARGDILALLEKEAKLKVVEVSDIKRQAGEYKEAVKLLADGKTGAAFHKLDKLGWVKDAGLVDDYLAAVRKGESVLVVSPTNAEADKLTAEIRERLKTGGKLVRGKEQGVLTGEDKEFTRLEAVGLTEAERSVSGNLEGLVAAFHHAAPGGVHAGDRIKATSENVADLANHARRFSVFREQAISLSVGDRIRATATVKALDGSRLDNGTQLTVTGFSDKGIHTKTATGLARILPPDVGHIAHAYVSTSHAAQGKTVERVFVHMPAATLPAVTSETAYVSVSRGKFSATVYCDNKEALLRQWGREDDRLLAHDLLRRRRFAERMRAFTSRMVAAVQRHVEHTQERKATYER